MNNLGLCRCSLAALVGLSFAVVAATSGCTHEWPTTPGQDPQGASSGGQGAGAPSYGGSGGGGGPDSLPDQGAVGGGDSGAGSGRCPSPNSVARLYDGFDAPGLNSQWTLVPANDLSVDVPNGQLMLSIVGAEHNQHGGIRSSDAYDLTDCEVSVAVIEPFVTESSGYAYLSVRTETNDVFEISLTSGRISMRQHLAGAEVQYLESLVYSPAAHRYLRLRDAANVLSWETSPDGRPQSWTTHAAEVRKASVSQIRVHLGGGTRPSGAAYPSDYATFDDVNILPR